MKFVKSECHYSVMHLCVFVYVLVCTCISVSVLACLLAGFCVLQILRKCLDRFEECSLHMIVFDSMQCV